MALIDSDDWVHRSYFEVLMHYAKQYDADISVCGHIRTSEQTDDLPVDYNTIHSYTISGLKMLDNDPVTHGYVWARIYRRSIVEGQLFSGVKVLDDAAYNFDVLSANKNVLCAVCGAKLYYYYKNPKSMMSGFGPESTRQVTEYYYSRFVKSTDEWQRYVYAIEILKNSIHYRYAVMFRKDHRQLCSHNRIMIKEALAEVNVSPLSTVKIKTIYHLLTAFPPLYRAFRIVTDPTMLDWEKNQKAIRKMDNK